MSLEDFCYVFMDLGIRWWELVYLLVLILRKYDKLVIKVLRIRRFVIELVVWMMEDDMENNVVVFRELGLEKEFEKVFEITAEFENFDVFFGIVGVSCYSRMVYLLVELVLKIFEDN